MEGGDKEISVAVHNDGPSISAEQLNGIFNPMKSREAPANASAGSQSNLGLGLYIAERIVHAHGGRIDVESADGKGTTFTIHLPRGDKTPDAAEATTPS